MKILKYIAIILLLALVLLQFYPSELNEGNNDSDSEISKLYAVPENVQQKLRVSCYDCHSNNTNYPWYNKIQPIALYLEDHIRVGKGHLNFDEFGSYDREEQKELLEEIVHEIKNGEMPLTSYTLIHREARLSETEKKEIIDWAEGLNRSL